MDSQITHVCPPFCHRCPDLNGDIMPHCYGCIDGRELDSCVCRGLTCAKCGESAEWRCTWPVEVMVPAVVHDLRHGDICSNLSRSRTGRILEIAAVENVPNPNLLDIKIIRYNHGKPAGGRIDLYTWDVSARVKVQRQAICGGPGCYRHIRDLDQGGFICSEHWAAQLALIA